MSETIKEIWKDFKHHLLRPHTVRHLLRPRKGIRAALVLAGTSTGLALHTYSEDVKKAAGGGFRTLRTFATAARIGLDYKISLYGKEYGTEEYTATRSEVHVRTGAHLLALARANQGFYVKAAQTISMMNLLPPSIRNPLKVLQAAAPFKDYSNIVAVFESEFGADPHALFAEFDEDPFAAASLAQVHKGVTHSGLPVAIKVQHLGLEEMIDNDLWAMGTIASLVPYFFDGLDLAWIVNEVRENIAMELDFVREGESAERVAKSLAHIPNVAVPAIHWETSSSRVLTMEFMPGFSIGNTDAIDAAGLDHAQLTTTLLTVFATMIFGSGYIHCDPHAGNILVDPNPPSNAPFRLVLLDHGLYREIDDQFRSAYCKLWVAMLTQNEELLDEACVGLGVPQYRNVFPLILTYRPWKGTEEQARKIRADLKNTSIAEVFEFLEGLPRDMLLVFRAQDLTRSINYDLGGTALDRFRIFLRAAIEGLYFWEQGDLIQPSFSSYVGYYWARFLMAASSFLYSSVSYLKSLVSPPPPTPSESLAKFERFRAKQG